MEIPPGEVSVLLGRSGTGKPVFLKSLIGLLRPERGKIIVDGTNIIECSAKERHSAWFRERRSDCLVDLRPGGRCQMDCGTAPMTKAPDVADAPFRCDHVTGGIRRQVTPFGWSRTVIRRRMAPQ
jgi:energy-coupling factor transporter ATP-binding protein EcfA2